MSRASKIDNPTSGVGNGTAVIRNVPRPRRNSSQLRQGTNKIAPYYFSSDLIYLFGGSCSR